MLEPKHIELVRKLRIWVDAFCHIKRPYNIKHFKNYQPGDVFIGYHSDIVSSIVLRLDGLDLDDKMILEKSKELLLSCATPDSVCRLDDTSLDPSEKRILFDLYYLKQNHCSLADFLGSLRDKKFVQVTTNSRLLTCLLYTSPSPRDRG